MQTIFLKLRYEDFIISGRNLYQQIDIIRYYLLINTVTKSAIPYISSILSFGLLHIHIFCYRGSMV